MQRLKNILAIVIVLYKLRGIQSNWKYSAIRYLDYSSNENDLYFDRTVPLALNVSNWKGNTKEMIPLALGVMISSDRILTSYNPFRLFIHNKTMLDNILASLVTGRTRDGKGRCFYTSEVYRISCGRQIIPDEEDTMHLCHGENGLDCPLHDLMVLRINGNATLTKMKTLDFSQFPDNVLTTIAPGVYLAEIAKPNDTLNDFFKFASLGLRSRRDMEVFRQLRKVEYVPDDAAVVDCDRWLPREWGHFICILNLGDYPGLGSGALLVSDEKIFGIGSFTLFRGKIGVFVFTDVRPYYDLIMNTCTYADSEEDPKAKLLGPVTW